MQKTSRSSRNGNPSSWIWPAALIALVVIFFWRSFITDQILMSNDASLATLVRGKDIIEKHGFLNSWSPGNWLGTPTANPAAPTWFLLYLMPVEVFARLIYAFHAIAVSLITFYWLRRMDLCHLAAFFGGLVMALAGSYLTYILPGHISKFEMTTFATLALLCVTRAMQTLHWQDFAWGGVALGLALEGAIDTGALMALLIGAWFLFSAGRRWLEVDDRTRRTWVLGFMLLTGLSGFCALPVIGSLMRIGLATNVPGIKETDTTEQNWQWATQWSYPPSETIDLFAPAYHGWKTQDPHGPYWGTLGRNPQFDAFATPADLLKAANVTNPAQASQILQFWNFRLNGDFHGSVTLLMIVLALVALFARETPASPDDKRSDWRDEWLCRHRAVIIFWAVVAGIALLTSFGRYFPPLFRLLHSLPLFNSMRNPNKLMVIVTPALAVLAAIGMDRLWRETESRRLNRAQDAKR